MVPEERTSNAKMTKIRRKLGEVLGSNFGGLLSKLGCISLTEHVQKLSDA
jgi:hypothetical protein